MKPPRIIAEMSANHLGSLDRAAQIIVEAAKAGADAVKLQIWTPGLMAADHIITEGPWAGRHLEGLYREAQTEWTWWGPLQAAAQMSGITLFASVFDHEALAFLETVGCPEYKISSFEIVDLPLIEAVAKTKKPMIISTGMATHDEIREAVTVARYAGCKDLTLLRCTSSYPAHPTSAGLFNLTGMAMTYGTNIGLSDHTTGIGTAVAASILGASDIEKHFTLTKEGPDAGFSITPPEMKAMVAAIKEACQAATTAPYPPGLDPSEDPQRALRRSLYWATDKKAGEFVKRNDIVTMRPAKGLPPSMITRIHGSTLLTDVQAGTPILQGQTR